MTISLKNNYIELSKKFGGPYSLISKGIKRGIITGILRGSMPKINEAYVVAKVLGVTLEQLLGEKEIEPPTPDTIELHDKTEREYVEKLLIILRTKQDKTVKAIIQNIDAFMDNPDRKREDSKKSTG